MISHVILFGAMAPYGDILLTNKYIALCIESIDSASWRRRDSTMEI